MFLLKNWQWLAVGTLILGCGGGESGSNGQGGGSSGAGGGSGSGSGSGSGGGAGGGSGNAYCLLTRDGSASSTCQGFEGFVDADAQASEVASCIQFGNQSLPACPASPSACCLMNGSTTHAFYTCYYGLPPSMVGLAQTTCSSTNGVWQSSVPF